MIRMFLELDLAGPLLVGGYSDPGGRADATTARDEQGLLIPATALRGAWREAYARLLASEDSTPTPCTPAAPCEGPYCGVCAIFGHGDAGNPLLSDSTGATDPDGWRVALRLDSARVIQNAAVPLEVRPNVSVDRYTRTQVPGRLFTRESATMGAQTTMRAAVVLRDESVRDQVARALPLWTSIGSGTSKGQGVVLDARLVPAEDLKDRPLRGSGALKSGASLHVVIKNLEPITLGDTPVDGNLRPTLHYVPGSAMAGAVVWAARRAGLEADGAARLAQGLSFSDLCASDAPDKLSIPMPRCFMRCAGEDGHLVDRSLIEAAQRALAEQGRGALEPARCPVCGSDLKAAFGVLGGGKSLRTRTVTRLARDSHRGTAAPAMLHVIEQVEPGQGFTGTVQVEPGADIEVVRGALQRLETERAMPILLGARRSKGMGTVSVELQPRRDDLKGRIALWRQTHTHLGGPLSKALGWTLAHMVLLVARTPVSEPRSAGTRIAQALGIDPSAIRASWVRTQQRAGWDGLSGQPTAPFWVASAGSAWLVELPSAPAPQLFETLETQGIETDPALRRLGLGLLYTCPHASH